VRLAAAEELGSHSCRLDLQQLIKGDNDDFNRLAACGDIKVLKALVASLSYGDKDLRRHVTLALLNNVSDQIVDLLIEETRSADRGSRTLAIEMLGRIKNLRALNPLITALDDPDDGVRYLAIEALSSLGDARAIEPLIQALGDWRCYFDKKGLLRYTHISYRHSPIPADELLSRLSRGQLALLTDIPLAAAKALSNLGEPQWQATVKGQLADFERLASISDRRAKLALIKALGVSNGDVRRTAAEALSVFGEPQWRTIVQGNSGDYLRLASCSSPFALGPIVDLTKWADARTIGAYDIAAIDALATIGDPQIARELLIVLLGEVDDHTSHISLATTHDTFRRAIAEALGKLGDFKWLNIILGDDHDIPRLGCCDDPRAVEPLIRMLHGWSAIRNTGKFSATALALGRLGNKRAIVPLIEFLSSAHTSCRENADDELQAVRDALTALGEPKWQYTEICSDTELGCVPRPNALTAFAELKRQYCRDVRAVEPVIATLRNYYCENDDEEAYRLSYYPPCPEYAIAAAEILSDHGDKRALEPLIECLDAPNRYVREAIAMAIVQFADENVVNLLIRFLTDEFNVLAPYWRADNLHAGAAFALGYCGDSRAVETLIGTLDTVGPTSAVAAKALARLGDRRAVQPLMKCLHSDVSFIAAAAARSLSILGAEQAILPLVELVHSNTYPERSWPLSALQSFAGGQVIDSLVYGLNTAISTTRLLCIKALDMHGFKPESDRALPEPLEYDGEQDYDNFDQYIFCHDDSIDSDEDSFGGEYDLRRESANQEGTECALECCWEDLSTWIDNRSEVLVEALIGALKDDELEVRQSAVKLLVRLKAKIAIEPMLQMLGTADVCAEVPNALASFRDARAVNPLVGSLASAHHDIKVCSARALGSLGDTRAVKPLISYLKLKEDSDSFRIAVVEALARIKDTQAVEPLIGCLERKEDSDSFRIAVAEALASIKDTRAIEPLIGCLVRKEDSDSFRIAVVKALASIKDTRAVEPLIGCLERKEDSDNFLVTAIDALYRIGDTRAIEPLICYLNTESIDSRKLLCGLRTRSIDSRAAAAMALGKYGDVRAVAPLVESLIQLMEKHAIITLHRMPDMLLFIAILRALGKLGNKLAIAPLVQILLNQHKDITRCWPDRGRDSMCVIAYKDVARNLCMILKMNYLSVWDVECLKSDATRNHLIEILRRYAPPIDWLLEPSLP
jgi:HEAT repeat protein